MDLELVDEGVPVVALALPNFRGPSGGERRRLRAFNRARSLAADSLWMLSGGVIDVQSLPGRAALGQPAGSGEDCKLSYHVDRAPGLGVSSRCSPTPT